MENMIKDSKRRKFGCSQNSWRKDNAEIEQTIATSLDINVIIESNSFDLRSVGIDFYLDFGLYDLMVAHMKSAVYRVMNGEVLVNPFKDEIISYPEILQIVRKELENLENFIGKKFRRWSDVSCLIFCIIIEKKSTKC